MTMRGRIGNGRQAVIYGFLLLAWIFCIILAIAWEERVSLVASIVGAIYIAFRLVQYVRARRLLRNT